MVGGGLCKWETREGEKKSCFPNFFRFSRDFDGIGENNGSGTLEHSHDAFQGNSNDMGTENVGVKADMVL
jgi:hypothetical protein